MRSDIKLYNEDCMPAMAKMKDNEYDLALVDPPYGIKVGGGKAFGKVGGGNWVDSKTYKTFDDSKPPEKEYFDELIRISKNQIMFGANHYISKIPYDSSCWIVWDKDNTGNFADCELAWTSFKTAVRKFLFRWNGLLQQNMKEKEIRIHPTQKPVQLYKWLLQNYAKEGDKILDTHLGSGSIAIACWDLCFDLTAFEIDKDYYDNAVARLERHKSQGQLF